MSTVFETLSKINVNNHTEKKGNLTYLSWAWAWGVTKENYPSAQYKTYENDLGFNYHTDGKTAWVKVGVTIEELEHIEYLPVMDFKNKSIPVDKITSFDVNTSIQRALTKAIARHGLGLYIYAGEDLPSGSSDDAREELVSKLNDLIKESSDAEKLTEWILKTYKAKSIDSMPNDYLTAAITAIEGRKNASAKS
jgi:hypothetical protein